MARHTKIKRSAEKSTGDSPGKSKGTKRKATPSKSRSSEKRVRRGTAAAKVPAEPEACVAWHELPYDVVELIFKQLPEESCRSARLVHKAWADMPPTPKPMIRTSADLRDKNLCALPRACHKTLRRLDLTVCEGQVCLCVHALAWQPWTACTCMQPLLKAVLACPCHMHVHTSAWLHAQCNAAVHCGCKCTMHSCRDCVGMNPSMPPLLLLPKVPLCHCAVYIMHGHQILSHSPGFEATHKCWCVVWIAHVGTARTPCTCTCCGRAPNGNETMIQHRS